MLPYSEQQLLGSKTDLCARARVVCVRDGERVRGHVGVQVETWKRGLGVKF